MLGFSQACRVTFDTMEEDREYLVEEKVWAEAVRTYQKRFQSTYSPERQNYSLKKSKGKLSVAGKEIWDFAQTDLPSTPLALALALSFVFAFAFSLAFASGQLEGLSKPSPESADNLAHILPKTQLVDGLIWTETGQCWLEARQVGPGLFQIAVGGISEDGLARIADIVRSEGGQ